MPMTTETAVSLAVRLYAMAMEQGISLAELAKTFGANAKQLRAFFVRPNDPEHANLVGRIAAILHEDRDTLLAGDSTPTASESFASWLTHQRQDMPIATLRSRATIGAGTLLRLRTGESLPDTDQAERLNQVLGTNRTEFARFVVADMIRRESYGTTRPATQTVKTTPVSEKTQEKEATQRSAPAVSTVIPEFTSAAIPALNGDQSSTVLAEARALEPEPELAPLEAFSAETALKKRLTKSTSTRNHKDKRKKSATTKGSKGSKAKLKSNTEPSFTSDVMPSSVNMAIIEEGERAENVVKLTDSPPEIEDIIVMEEAIPVTLTVRSSHAQAEQVRQELTLVSPQQPGLTESEARLIKNFRSLHPQAQRAVDLYIGSLLVM